MASDLNIQAEVAVNAEQAERAFDRLGDKAQQMANEVATSAGKAGQAVDKIGDGAGASVEKFTRAESRMSAAIKKATNELELLGKTASQRLEFNISDKGLDPKKFEPMLQRLREVEAQAQAAQRAATGSLDKMGISAAQTAAALRGVPAQFTDIVTSLQGGQAPLTVFLQQGGQLKDMFGGAGAAARALGGYVVGLINPLTVAAAAAVALAVAYNQGSKEADAYNKALIATGNAAGTNAAQLKTYAQEISAVVGTQGKAAESLAALAATGKIGADSLRDAALAAVQYERATGQALEKTAEQFASLRNDPLAAVLKLNESMNFLTESTYRQIQSLAEQGKAADAARLAQESYADALSGRASRIERNLGSIERGWLAIKDAAKAGWDAMLNVGRASTSQDALGNLRARLTRQQDELAQKRAINPFADTSGLERGIEVMKQRIGLMESDERQTRRLAGAEAERAAQLKALTEWDKEGLRYLSDKQKMERELTRAQNEGVAAGRDKAEIEQRLAQIRESYAKKGAGGAAAENKELRDQMRVYADLAGVSSTYYTDLANYQKQRANNLLTEEQYVKLVEQLIAKQPFAVAQAKEMTEATKAQAKVSEEAARAHLKFVESFGKGASAAQQQVDQLKTEEAAAAIAADGYYSLAQAIELVHIARLEEQQQGLLGNEEAYLAVQKEIDARKELIGLIGSKEARKAAEDSAKDAAKEWERSARDIERALTDSLLRGFESGKGFAKNFVDTMRNLFSTLVLRPVISAIVSPVAGAVTGALGLSSPAAAAGTVGNVASGVGLLGRVGGMGSGFMNGLSAWAPGGSVTGVLSNPGLYTGAEIAGALAPIALGIGALALIIGKTKGETRTGGQFGVAFDGSVTNQRRGETYTYQGQQFDRDFSNGARNALVNGQAYRLEGDPVAQESAIRDAVAGTATGINGFFEALGSSVRLTGYSAGLETSGKGRGGVFAGGILSDGSTFGESGKGDNYAKTLYESFSTNSPDFKQALADFTLDLKQSTIQALQTVDDIPETVKKMLANVDAEGLTEEAANQLLESINAQIVGVNQLTSAFEAMGMDKLADMGFDAAAGLAEAAGGFDKLMGSLNTFYTNFYTSDEQRANIERELRKQLEGVGLKLPDINSADARAQYRALVEAASNDLSEEGRKTYNILLANAGAFASVTEAVESTTKSLEQQRESYYSALQRAVSAQNKALQSQLDAAQEVAGTLESLFDILHDNVRDLYGEVDSTRGMQAAQGNSFIDAALAAAKKSGYLLDADKLAEAIAGARSGIGSGGYVSQFAEDRDRLVLAGKLLGLETITEKQLTDAQKTVRALETQIDQGEQVLDYWRQQIEIASGTYDGIMSVEAAIQGLQSTLNPTAGKPGGANTVGGGSTPASGTGVPGRVNYSSDEALESFDKFKAWYADKRLNADPSKLMDEGYQVPDWMRFHPVDADATDKEQFGSYLFFKNNPQYLKDFEQILNTGRSSFSTDGSTLVKSDLSKMPKEAADFYKGNTAALLGAEAWGLDPALTYQLYTYGPQQFGLDGKKQSFTEWLQTHSWTDQGLVDSNNVVKFGTADWQNYSTAKWQTSTGNIIDTDGTIYTKEGKRLRMATPAEFAEVFGPNKKPTGTAGSSARDDYLNTIRNNTDDLINKGWSAQQLADALVSTGTSLSDIAAAYNIPVQQVIDNLKAGGATNIPKFDIGTNYVPRDMLAYIHEGEAVVPKAYNPMAGGSAAGGNAELIAEMRAMREAIAVLQAAAAETAGNTRLMPQMGRQFDQVAGTGRVLTKAT